MAESVANDVKHILEKGGIPLKEGWWAYIESMVPRWT